MSTKRFTLTAFVVLLILAFAITTVGADADPPSQVGVTDEDGDLIVDLFPQVDISAARRLPDLGSLAELSALPAGGISVDTAPIAPFEEYVHTKYPTFLFSEDGAAIKYQIEVYDIIPEPDVLLYKFSGPPNCSAGTCQLIPTTALKPLTIFYNKGYYGWRVRSKTLSGWGAWSEPVSFIVLKNGFNSPFTLTENKWFEMYGDWTLTSMGYAKTKGELYMISSAMEKHKVSDFYVYEVKMKRKVESFTSNRIYFQAEPTPLAGNKAWDSGYFFEYTNNQYWNLWKVVNGSNTLLLSGTSPYINAYEWNTLTVFTDTPWIDLWINGHYLGCTGPFGCAAPTDSTFSGGFVGFAMYEGDADNSPLLVDYPKLYYTSAFPYPGAVTADGQRVPVETTQLPQTGLDPNISH